MNLVACLICRNEISRYLDPCVRALLAFCDEVRVVDDGSTDGTLEWLAEQDRVSVKPGAPGGFFLNESQARNVALAWAMAARPSHLLAVDADEFVSDGVAVREACEANLGRGVWSLGLQEVWKADARALYVREDGGWRMQEQGVPILWRAPTQRLAKTGAWQIPNRRLACGREPLAVRRAGRALAVDANVLHFGWANVAERRERYERYVAHDGGRFHRKAHLDSIMWPDSRVKLRRRAWPAGLDRAAILGRVERAAVPA